MNFVSCSMTSCQLNEMRQCRAPFLMVDINGDCVILESGPHDNKSQVENYVEVKECNCKRCNYWERNEVNGLGKCGNTEPLHFGNRLTKSKCHSVELQIDEPPAFGTIVPIDQDKSNKPNNEPPPFLVNMKK